MAWLTELLFPLSLAAFLTAALSGVAGMGGGTILIGLFYAAGLTATQAVPLFAAVQFVSNSSRTIAYLKHVEWRATGWFLLTALPAPFLIAPYVAKVNAHLLELLMAALIIISLLPGKSDQPLLGPRASFMLAGLLNGSVGMFVGATGLFVGRLFLRPEWRKEQTIATLALTQMLGHALKVAGFAAAGYSAFTEPQLLAALALAVIAGTAAGKWLNGRVSEVQFKQLVTAILWLLSAKLLLDAMTGLEWIRLWN